MLVEPRTIRLERLKLRRIDEIACFRVSSEKDSRLFESLADGSRTERAFLTGPIGAAIGEIA